MGAKKYFNYTVKLFFLVEMHLCMVEQEVDPVVGLGVGLFRQQHSAQVEIGLSS
jgi:hypothetical protein